ncbi:MAG: hypothetical protein GF364_18325, partial [Candidatus Lokiarchaeota archaeon]|nr:hypothetical protein [Candidatus Lokiarchaeota archaeon]
MTILEMDVTRIVQVYVIQLGLGIVYLFIGWSILRRDRKRLNQMIAAFYISIFIGMVFNVIYAPLESNPAVIILHLLTDFFLFIPSVLLLIFNLIILKSQKIFDTKKQLAVFLSFAILLAGMAFIPGGITIDETTNWKPLWSLGFVLYVFILATLG